METSRRDFLKKVGLISAGLGVTQSLPYSIKKALAIDPQMGSTFLDAEHIVLLMQENRSFDHTFGALQGVRGFNNPRVMRQPNGHIAYLQTNAEGKTFAPFRLNMFDTKSTWMSGLPHSWRDQVDALNNNRYDKWLIAKKADKKYEHIPFTLGFYNRQDLPFYYAMADAFTVCDHNFCSSLTGTTPNRLYFWTGTIRQNNKPENIANVENSDVDYGKDFDWESFPEVLERNGISWRIYQNELSLPVGLNNEEESWLANFTDNPMEWAKAAPVKFHPAYQKYIRQQTPILATELKRLEALPTKSEAEEKDLKKIKTQLLQIEEDIKNYGPAAWEKLSPLSKQLVEKCFTTNIGDPHYHQLETIRYESEGVSKTQVVPKGDVLHQFRKDVKERKLPAVSWLVPPQQFSDHPSTAWFGAWYAAEVMDILTADPEVWKKTIFIITYDENDGYFDHLVPYCTPHPKDKSTGAANDILKIEEEFVTLEQDLKRVKNNTARAREHAIGLGYRVPLLIASPWSRGGWVNSQVFDHTSSVQLLEQIFSHKLKKPIRSSQISNWRRNICGDLTSVFQPYEGKKQAYPTIKDKQQFIIDIYKAKDKKLPDNFAAYTATEAAKISQKEKNYFADLQEQGVRKAPALPYEMFADASLAQGKLIIDMKASSKIFGAKAMGFPLKAYSYIPFKNKNGIFETGKNWDFNIARDSSLQYAIDLNDFEAEKYHIALYGPNGFFRDFSGNKTNNAITVKASYSKDLVGKKQTYLVLDVFSTKPLTIQCIDNSYGQFSPIEKKMAANTKEQFKIAVTASQNWYDVSIKVKEDAAFAHRYAGKVEDGNITTTDPFMGNVV